MAIDPNAIIIGLLLTIILILGFWLWRTEIRLKRLFRGRRSQNLETIVNDLQNDIQKLKTGLIQAERVLAYHEARLKKVVSRVSTIRFNPFQGQGGNQSFVSCFLNDQGNGVVISSLYSRDKVSVYAKPIIGGRSNYELTAEEKRVINEAGKTK
jgi:hypothetical protein